LNQNDSLLLSGQDFVSDSLTAQAALFASFCCFRN
jgi:hypothetical protein